MTKPPIKPDGGAPNEADLLQRLAGIAAQIDPPPEMAYELGRQLFSLRRIEEELAELVADSAADAAPTRAAATEVRLLSFDCSSTTLDIQVSSDNGRYSVLGMLSGDDDIEEPWRVEVELHSLGDEARSTTADAEGRFEFADVTPSMVRFVLRLGGALVSTAWVRL